MHNEQKSIMTKIAVFDSGLGSLSIIKAIQKITKAKIIYFADQKHYPYGTKTNKELRKIIESTINLLKTKFNPDVVIVGSNTPTILFPELFDDKTVTGVLPPLLSAIQQTKTKSIAILATRATIKSKQLNSYIAQTFTKISSTSTTRTQKLTITKIDATQLIDLVESGNFLSNKKHTKIIIQNMLSEVFLKKNIDVALLSSTHLPFLNPFLTKLFPQVLFLDPADEIAVKIKQNKSFQSSKKNSLKIFCSINPDLLKNNLSKLKIQNKVNYLKFE